MQETIKHSRKEVLYSVALGVLSVSIVLLLYFLLFSTNHFYPFSKDGQTVLMIDAQSQYISYLRYYRNLLLNKGSFIYTTSKAFGGDFLSLYSYYLASPFNLLLVFFKEEDIPFFLLLTSALKMSVASLNMYLLFLYLHKKPSLLYLASSVGYGLVSYAFIYLSNFMWLDGVMILPLVALGLFALKKREFRFVYPLALAYALISSWYIGAMVCLFVVLFFSVLLFDEPSDKETILRRIRDFLLFSLIGGLLSCFIWVPAFFHFSGTKVHTNFPDLVFYPITHLIDGFLADSYQSVGDICQNDGILPAFTSIPALLMAVYFFFNKGISLRKRIAYLCLVVFYLVMASTTITNTLLHFGSAPTWFPSRFGFLLAFLVSFLGNEELCHMEEKSLLGYLFGDIVIVVFLLLALFVPNIYKRTYSPSLTSWLIFTATILFGWMELLLHKFFANKKFTKPLSFSLKALLVPLCMFSSYEGANHILSVNQKSNAYQSQETYLKDCSYQNTFEVIKNYDSSHNYRMESTFNRPGNYNRIDNNPMFYSYAGLSHFSSSEKKDVESYMTKLGFHYNYFFEKYDGGSTLSMNAFLGIKYLIDDGDTYATDKPTFFTSDGFEKLPLTSDKEEMKYYENKYALPFGFVTGSSDVTYVNEGKSLEDGEVYWFDDFEYQNEIFKELVPSIDKDIFTKVNYSTSLSGLALVYSKEETKDYYYQGKAGDIATYTFDIPTQDNNVNYYFGLKDHNSYFNVILDSRSVEMTSYWHKGIRGIKNTPGTHTIHLVANHDFDHEHLRPEIYKEDLSVLKEYIDALKKQASLNLLEKKSLFSYGYEGNFDYEGEEDSDFLFTLPYEKEFSIYIDNKRVKTYTRFNIFTSASLKGLRKGVHSIEIRYTDTGFMGGVFLSIAGLGCLVAGLIFYTKDEGFPYTVLTRRKPKKRGFKRYGKQK